MPRSDDIYTRFKNHGISLTRDRRDEDWYIRVRAPDGCYVYDGWWRDSAEKTAKDALFEAKVGAGLIPAPCSMDPFRAREIAPSPSQNKDESSLNRLEAGTSVLQGGETMKQEGGR